jgi:hypothetical protein
MTINKSALLLGLVLALPLATGCAKKSEEGAPPPTPSAEATPTTTETEVPGTTSPSDLSPATAQARVDDVKVGHALDADGKIADDKKGDKFAPGKTVYVSMSVGDTPASSAIKVVWYGPNDTRISDETKTVETGQHNLNFSSGDTAKWAKGDYHVEVWIADEKVNTENFSIVDTSKADKVNA